MPFDPLIGSAIVSGVSGLFGSGLSGGMSKRAAKAYNKGQMEIAQMNNQWNAEQAAINREWQSSERDAQNEWNLAQWNRENEYNSPAAQRARLEEAGYNPYMEALGSTTGTGKSSASVSGVGNPTASPINQVPETFQMSFNGVADAINSFYQNQLNANQAKGQGISNAFDLQFGSDFRKAQISSLVDGRFETLSPEYRTMRQAMAPYMAITDMSKSRQELEAIKTHTQLTIAQSLFTGLQAKGQEIMNRFLPAQQQAQYYAYAADAFSKMANGQLSLASIKNRLAEYAETMARTQGLKISNKISGQLADDTVRAMKEEYQSNAAYYRSFKTIAGSVATSRGLSDIYQAELDKIAKDSQELMLKRESHSLMNRKKYFRAQQIWKDFIGGTLGPAAAAALKVAK